MFENRVFQVSLAISFAAHSIIIFAGFPRMSLFSDSLNRKNKYKEMEILYYQIKNEPLSRISPQAPLAAKLPNTRTAIKPPMPLERKASVIEHKPELFDARLKSDKSESPASFTVDLSNIAPEFKGKPLYLDYFQAIRERIRQRALKNYPRYPISGQITLSFVLLSSGELKSLKIINEKSSQNQHLRDAALQSIKDASPYPPFPASFKQPEITFNILISFELSR